MLAGDIGGTRARIALVDVTDAACRVLVEREYPSAAFQGLTEVVERFRSDAGDFPPRASFAVAGPVVDGAGVLTNLGWRLDAASLARDLGVEDVRLLNDFEAAAHALPVLGGGDLITLQNGVPRTDAPVAILGAGTGLGQALLFRKGEGYRVYPSEGGHVDFAPRNTRETELLLWLRKRLPHVSVERVVSGGGIMEIYDFVRHGLAGAAQHRAAAAATGPTPATIAEAARTGSDPAAVEALEIFAGAYGAHAGNLALTLRADGGVYVAGGIAARQTWKMTDGTFLAAFRSKGRLTPLLERIPVHLIVNESVGLLGAAIAAVSGGARLESD